MWQRIQTIWLLISSLSIILFILFPFAFLVPENNPNLVYEFNAWGLKGISGGYIYSNWAVLFLSILIFVLSFVSIFMYKKRIRQARIVTFSLLILIGNVIYIGYLIYRYTHLLSASFSLRFTLVIPLYSIILLIMAIRRIYFDEALVRASNRIR